MVYGPHQEDQPQVPIYGDNIIGDQSQQEASVPRALKTPLALSQEGINNYNLAHLPYRDCCKHCVQGRSRRQYPQKGGLRKQSITQIDYAFLMSDNDRHNATVLTMRKSTTGLGHATMVPYKIKGSTKKRQQRSRDSLWRMDYKPQCNQMENEQSLHELLTELGRQLPHVKIQTAPQHSLVAIIHKDLSNVVTKHYLHN
eukprot:2510690-Amphidinium_carterae.2